MSVVWHDPSAIQREVWVGAAVVAASVAFTVFALYVVAAPRGWIRRYRLLVLLGAWLTLLTVQLTYVSSSATVFYGVYYDEVTGEYRYFTAANPMLTPVVAVTIVTAVVAAAFALYVVAEEWGRRLRRMTGWYVE